MNTYPEISPATIHRVETQERLQRLAAEAHLATRAVERVLRARSWSVKPIGPVEASVAREHIDQATSALVAIWQELDQA